MSVVHKLILFAGIVLILSGCVGEDRDECGSQWLNIHFYSKNSCRADTVYPAEIHTVLFGIFNAEGILATSYEKKNIQIQSGYFEPVEVAPGDYSVIAWSGIDNANYDIFPLQNGITTKEDLLFRLKRVQNQANSITGTYVFFGESPVVSVPENSGRNDVFERVDVNMQEITNRITVSLEDVPSGDEFEIIILSDNGSMNVNGIIANDDIINYPAVYSLEEKSIHADFTVLKLQSNRINTLIIRNITAGTEIYNGDLLNALILKNPDIDLSCDHDFVIRFTLEEQNGTYAIANVYINGWLLHSYNTNM